jgi:hypothetical protein
MMEGLPVPNSALVNGKHQENVSLWAGWAADGAD